ncbi:glycosyltransferase [Nocardioides sp.]|uniref:glycosyltransferase n=1 Tax=Nocardioides sp. TaxID=35761 RepID=UPI0035187431
MTATARPGAPRVLVVDHSAALSGAELFLHGMLAHADLAGDDGALDVSVLLLEDGPLRERLEGIGCPVQVLTLAAEVADVAAGGSGGQLARAATALPAAVRRLRAHLRGAAPDVVYTNSAKAHVLMTAALVGTRIPVVLHVHDRIAADSFGRANRAALHTAVARAATVLVNSEATRDSLRPRQRARAVNVPCPVDLPAAPAAPPADDVAPAFALVGRISPWKGQDVAIEARARLRTDAAADSALARAELHLYGDALFPRDVAYREQAQARAAELGVASAVHWHGHVADVPGALGRHHAVVHASTRPEPFGQVVLEAMACGLPVIAADAGGPRELIEHGTSGWLYPPGDAVALAAALATVLGSADLRSRLGAAARRRAGDLTYDRVVPGWAAAVRATARA